MTELKRTALYQWHVDNGANIAPFGAYEMPLWYRGGAKAEHLAVITAVGLFDTSHMAAIKLTGPGSRALLQICFTKDLDRCLGPGKTPLVNGRCVYGVFLRNDATVIDDAIVYQFQADEYLVVVNAGMGGVIADHLQDHIADAAVTISDLTDRLGKMDVQGPKAAQLMARLLDDPTILTKFPYFSCKGGTAGLSSGSPVLLRDGTPILLSRTGYTGEFGFEIFSRPEDFVGIWQMILDAGTDFLLLPCGLAARDSLRAGAVLPLSHQDIGSWPFANTPWPFALATHDSGEGFTKDFIGRATLSTLTGAEYTLPFAGYDPRKIVPGPDTAVLNEAGEKIGRILTCATDMAIGRVGEKIISLATSPADGRPADFNPRGLCCGFVIVRDHLPPGDKVILTDGKKKITVEIRQDVRPDRTARRSIATLL